MLVSVDNGNATAYALAMIEPRGILFIGPQEQVYEVRAYGHLVSTGASST